MEGAAKNMAAEAPHNDFDKYLAETKDNWNRQLGKIEVTGDNKDDKVNFYTALYHTMIARLFIVMWTGLIMVPIRKFIRRMVG